MREHKYILKGHTPIPEPDPKKWAEWYEKARDACRVAFDEIGGMKVSTVFLGSDYNFLSKKGNPSLFETSVRGGKDDEMMQRYFTWQEAETGHAELVKRIKAETAQPKPASPAD